MATKQYDDAHDEVLSFVGASPQQFTAIFTANTTYALNILAHRLPLRRRDIVLISDMEHHSNDLPWRARATVKRIKMTPGGAIDADDYMRLLNTYGNRVKVVALSGASNVTGYTPDLAWFARQAHIVGAQFAVDAAQLVAHRLIRMGSLEENDHIDFLAFSAHKMYAPFGIGVLVARSDALQQGAPFIQGGGTVNIVTRTGVDWAPLPDRDEAGSPNVVGVVALVAAMRTLTAIGFDAIAAHETALIIHAFARLGAIPGVKIYGDPRPAKRVGAIAFSLKGVSHDQVAEVLAAKGIGVRSGCFCAHPFVFSLLGLSRARIGHVRRAVAAGNRASTPGLVRISFGLYNTVQEIDYIAEVLSGITTKRR